MEKLVFKMNADAYETLPTSSIGVHMMAGACAGIMEHCIMYSVDSVKVNFEFYYKISIVLIGL